jgi:hypothetical protein
MRDAVKAEASYGGKRSQTRYFYVNDPIWLEQNIAAARELVGDAIEIDGATPAPNGEGQVILCNVKVDSIIKFLRSYQFHPDSFELDAGLIARYIERQNDAGRLLEWNVALMGGEPTSEGEFDFGHSQVVPKVRRSQLTDSPPDYADIKTLMSKEHRVIDLSGITQREARLARETRLMQMRTAEHPGLLALYPIDAHSPPDEQNADTRKALDADDDVMGAALVFPGTGDEEAVEYVSADLTKLGLTEADIEEPEDEDPEEEEVEAVA